MGGCSADPTYALPFLQGRHADRLFTVSYLPVNFLVLLAVIRHHTCLRPSVRIVGGFLGFTLAVSAVPLVSPACTAGFQRIRKLNPFLLVCLVVSVQRTHCVIFETPGLNKVSVGEKPIACWLAIIYKIYTIASAVREPRTHTGSI